MIFSLLALGAYAGCWRDSDCPVGVSCWISRSGNAGFCDNRRGVKEARSGCWTDAECPVGVSCWVSRSGNKGFCDNRRGVEDLEGQLERIVEELEMPEARGYEKPTGPYGNVGCLKRTAAGFAKLADAKDACDADSECGAIERCGRFCGKFRYYLCEGSETKETGAARVMVKSMDVVARELDGHHSRPAGVPAEAWDHWLTHGFGSRGFEELPVARSSCWRDSDCPAGVDCWVSRSGNAGFCDNRRGVKEARSGCWTDAECPVGVSCWVSRSGNRGFCDARGVQDEFPLERRTSNWCASRCQSATDSPYNCDCSECGVTKTCGGRRLADRLAQ